MKKIYATLSIVLSTLAVNAQTTHQVCIAEVNSVGACNSTTGIFTPGNLTIAVGDQIQFTTHMILLAGYNGTHTIQFTGSAANNVSLPISTNILAPVTTVTTPPFTTPGVFPMECTNSDHCLYAELFESWSCTGYSVTVVSSCAVDADFTASATTVCEGSTINFTNTSTGATSYSWRIDDVEFSTATNASYDFVDDGTYTVELFADDGSCDDAIEMVITVMNQESAGNDYMVEVCNEATTMVPLGASLSGNTTTGVWAETTSSGQFNSTNGDFDASGLTPGDYLMTYTVNSTSPCVNDVADFTVTVKQQPSVTVDLATTTVFTGEVLDIDFTAQDLLPGATFLWSFCDGNNSSSTIPFTYTWNTPGTAYCVCVEVNNLNGCVASDCVDPIQVTDASGLVEINPASISIYPNPAKGMLYIDLNEVASDVQQITVRDAQNKEVMIRQNNFSPTTILSLEDFPAGLYFVQISGEKFTTTLPVVVE